MAKYDSSDHERFMTDCKKINEFIEGDKTDEVRAILNNKPELAEYLATNKRVPNYGSPLHVAAWKGNLQMIRLLIEEFNHCIDVKKQFTHFLDETPLHFAIVSKHPAAVQMLVNFGVTSRLGVDI